MGVLHAGIFPVGQLQARFALVRIEQEVVRYGIDVGQAQMVPPGHDKVMQLPHFFLGLCIIGITGRLTAQGFIVIDMIQDAEFMADFQIHFVEAPQQADGCPDIFFPVRVTVADIVQEAGDFQAVFRVHVHNIITEAGAADDLIDFGFLPAVDQILGAFAGNPQNIFFAFAGKQERAVGHAVGHRGEIRQIPELGAQRFRNDIQFPGMEGRKDLFLDVVEGFGLAR